MKISTAITLCGAAVLGLSGPAQAEGARQSFDCTAVTQCDGQGNCDTTTGALNFQLFPVDVGNDGGGSFEMFIGDYQTIAQVSADYMVRWTGNEGTTQNQLIFTDENTAIWVSHRVEPSRHATIQFLTCVVGL